MIPAFHPNMSAAADESAPAGANPSSLPSSGLQQPTDAVAMESMAQSSQEAESTKPAADNPDANAQTATEPTAAAAAAEPGRAQSDDHADPLPSKGKNGDDEAPQPPLKERQDSIMAIGPAQDEVRAVDGASDDVGPVCNITLLLTSGSRHPYRISAKYLNRRNVPIPEEAENGLPDPFSISVYTLKELILREWRNDWEAKPASPSSIRLIHFGKLLDDKEPLKSMR